MCFFICGLIVFLFVVLLVYGQDFFELLVSVVVLVVVGLMVSMFDVVDLEDICNFSWVFEVVCQVYVEKVDNKILMKVVISGMLFGLDLYSEYLDKDGLVEFIEDIIGVYSGLGIEVIEQDGQLCIVLLIDDMLVVCVGIKFGDIIVKIDGKLIIEENIDVMFKDLCGELGSKVIFIIVYDKSDKLIDLLLVCEKILVISVCICEIEFGYVYICISQFQEDIVLDLEKKVGELIVKYGVQKGVVFDLCFNFGGLLIVVVVVSDDLFDVGIIVIICGCLVDVNFSFIVYLGDLFNGVLLVVLVDNGIVLVVEIVFGVLKDNYCVLIIGKCMFGKGVVQIVLLLDVEYVVKIIIVCYYMFSGILIQVEGIKLDIVLVDFIVNKVDSGLQLIIFEVDFSYYFVNEDGNVLKDINNDGSVENVKLVIQDYVLLQVFNVFKGLVLNWLVVVLVKC